MPPPTINNVAPALALCDGGQAVQITGLNFDPSVKVKFGNVKATKVNRVSATRIDAVAPPQAVAGAVTVTVTNSPGYLRDGPSAAWAGQFQYYAKITGADPAELATSGGAVTIHGIGFPVGARVQVVRGGGIINALLINRASATQIDCTLQQGAEGAAELRVLNPLPDNNAVPFTIFFCNPLILSLRPARGRLGGLNPVTIIGKHFVAGTTVQFDGAPAAVVNVVSSTQLDVQPAAHLAGLVAVAVTNPALAPVGGPNPAPAVGPSSSTTNNGYQYESSVVLSVEPNKGPAAGGTPVRIKGRGFRPLAVGGVLIGGVAAINEARVDDDAVTATTQAAAPGAVPVSVQNNLGDVPAVLAAAFTFVAQPTVTALEPANGPEGTTVVVQGTLFEKGATVSLGGVAATNVEVISATAIRCMTPAHALGAVNVDVRNDGGDAGSLVNGFRYAPLRIEPARGLPAGGDNVTVYTSIPADDAVVSFDSTVATIVAGAGLVVTTPAHAAGPVDVAVDDRTILESRPHVLNDGFEYAAIAKIEPNAGPANTQVDIHGSGFDGTTTVSFDGNNAAIAAVVSAALIQVTAPAHAPGPVNVVVANAGAGTFPNGYIYQPAATVTGVDPPAGTSAGHTAITITGTGFIKGATVAVAGAPAGNVVYVSPTTLTATTPPAAGGAPFAAVNVSVTNRGAPAAAVGPTLFTYRVPPSVTANADPAIGPHAGGRGITVTGSDFLAGAKVFVGGALATDVEFVNVTTLRCRVPAHAAGAVDIAVQNPGDPGPAPGRANSFTYVADPHTATAHNRVQFLLDGERYFNFLREGFEWVRQQPSDPDGLTYVRLAYWDGHVDVTLGDRTCWRRPNHTLVSYVERVVRAGHHVEVILWRPNVTEQRVAMGKGVYAANRPLVDALHAVDVAMANVAGAGRVRVYFEHSEGDVGAALHQKIAIFSVRGERIASVGGLNLSNGYFAAPDHLYPPPAAGKPWHDAAVVVRGPATDDIEREWMRRWRRARTLESSWYGLANVYGHGGEFLSRDFSFFNWATVRQREIETVENTRSQPPQAQNTPVTIAVTRSVGSTRYRHIRDKVIERINAANNEIYFENYHFCDPDLVQAIVARHAARSAAGADLRVAVVIPHRMNPDSSYLTRRAWLHFALTFVNGATGASYCTRVVYDVGAGPVTVMRAACAANWNVVDSYNPAAPTATNWLETDTLTFNQGAGAVNVHFHQILAVESAIHFYSAIYFNPPPPPKQVYTHAKVAAFDGQWLVVGSANWSFRSMQYDAEISAFIDSNAITGNALNHLLAHYNTGAAAPTVANVEGVAVANLAAPAVGQIRLYPCEHYNAAAPLGPNNPHFPFSRAVPRGLQITNALSFFRNPQTPNYTWL